MTLISAASPSAATTTRVAFQWRNVHTHALLYPQCTKTFFPWRRPLQYCRGNRATISASSNPPHSPLSQPAEKKNWERILSLATSLYPVYVTAGGIIALTKPSAFTWFVSRGPSSYSLALATIMLAMGLSLSLEELIQVVTKRPFQLIFGCAAQYTLMPLLGAIISKGLGLSTDLSAGLILLGCCPGGTASNVVTLIAGGDVPLSVVMTSCTTLAAVFATPLLTQILAGAYVPVDAVGLALSTVQVVLAPIIIGAWMQSSFPRLVARIIPFSPITAVLISSLLACSVFSANVGLLVGDAGPLAFVSSQTSYLIPVVQGVILLHACGFLAGYLVSAVVRLEEPERRAVSIEVGMQNSSLGVVLATTHFTSAMVAMPAAISAVIMNIMGSSLAVVWSQYGRRKLDKGLGES